MLRWTWNLKLVMRRTLLMRKKPLSFYCTTLICMFFTTLNTNQSYYKVGLMLFVRPTLKNTFIILKLFSPVSSSLLDTPKVISITQLYILVFYN